MSNKSGALGREGENAVARVFRENGWPEAERRRLKGALDQGDLIVGDRRLCVEVKNGKAARSASDNQITSWMHDTERERLNAGADIGILVVARKGIGYPNAGNWAAYVPLWTVARLVAGPPGHVSSLVRNTPVRFRLTELLNLLNTSEF